MTQHGPSSASSESVALSDEPLPGRHVGVGSVRFWVTQHGSGPPLLFLHGLPTTSFLWRNIQRLLAAEFSTFAPDLVGCGRTEAPAGTSLRLEEQSELIPGLLDALEIRSAVVIAHDVGGAVAQYLAARHPDRVRALVLMDVAAHARYWPVRLVKLLRTPLLGDLLKVTPRPLQKMLLRSRLRKGLAQRQRLKPAIFHEYADRLLRPEGPAEFLSFVRGFDPPGLEKVVVSLRDTHLPRLILWADDDAYQPLRAGQEFFDSMSSGKFVHIADAGHFLQEDQPQRVAQEIRTFLRALPPEY